MMPLPIFLAGSVGAFVESPAVLPGMSVGWQVPAHCLWSGSFQLPVLKGPALGLLFHLCEDQMRRDTPMEAHAGFESVSKVEKPQRKMQRGSQQDRGPPDAPRALHAPEWQNKRFPPPVVAGWQRHPVEAATLPTTGSIASQRPCAPHGAGSSMLRANILPEIPLSSL